jgi:hypothetical protein
VKRRLLVRPRAAPPAFLTPPLQPSPAGSASLAALAGATGQPLVIRRVPLSSLHQDPANARSHPERNLASIRASLARFGQAEPLVVLKGANRVIGGNGRLVAMQSLGWTECDIVELELSPVEAAALGIALNRTAELAEWDPKALAAVVESLRTENALEGIGFDAREIDKLIAQAASLDSLVDSIAPAPPDRATTRLGDLWILGSHRLLCGDSSDRASLERLLGGQRIQLVNTDPPYNVAVEPRSNNAIAAGFCSFPSGARAHLGDFDLARHPEKAKATTAQLRPKDRPLANDAVSVEEFDRLLRAWFGNLAFALEPGARVLHLGRLRQPQELPARDRRQRAVLQPGDHLGEEPPRPRPQGLHERPRVGLLRLA